MSAGGNVPLVYVNREPDNANDLPATQAFVASNEIDPVHCRRLKSVKICVQPAKQWRTWVPYERSADQPGCWQRSKDVYDVIGMDALHGNHCRSACKLVA